MLNFINDLPAFALGRRINSEDWNAFTRTMEAANNDVRIGFGVPVTAGTGRKTVIEVNAAGQVFLGVTETSHILPRPGDGYARYDEVPVLEWGVIGVNVSGNITAGAQARWNTGTKRWTAAAASGTVLTIPGATFEMASTGDVLAPVRLRRPNPATVTGA